MRWLAALALGVALAASTCADLSGPQEGVCGNFIVEGDEDCDPPGEGGGQEFGCSPTCQHECNEAGECPAGYVCDIEGSLCWQPSWAFSPSETDLVVSSSGELLYTAVSDLASVELDGALPNELIILGQRESDEERVIAATFDASGARASLSLVQRGLKPGVPLAVGAGPRGAVFVAPHPRAASVLPLFGREDGSILRGLGGQWGGLDPRSWLTPGVKRNESGTFGYVGIFGGDRATQASDGLFGSGVIVETPFLIDAHVDSDPSLQLGSVASAARLLADRSEVLGVSVRATDPQDSHVRIYPEDPLLGFLRIDLPEGKNVEPSGGVWFAHTDSDVYLDVLVALDDGSTYRAFGGLTTSTPAGYTFTSSPGLVAPDFRLSSTPYLVDTHPLAVGLIDGDERTDFVLPGQGIALSAGDDVASFTSPCSNILGDIPYDCGLHGVALDPSSVPTWTEAVLADFNGDGRTDVAAADFDSKQVDVFYGSYSASGAAVLFPRPIPASGPPRSLTVVDLDGDLLHDLAFTAPAAEGARALSISYGAASGPMSEPEVITVAREIADVSTISTGRDLFLLWRDDDDEDSPLVWSSITGGAQRVPVAPLLLPCARPTTLEDDELVVAQQLVAGDFLGQDRDSPALLYQDCLSQVDAAERLVLVPSTQHGGLAPVLDEPLDLGACNGEPLDSCYQAVRAFSPEGLTLDVPRGFSKTALTLAADLDHDGRDELVLVGPEGDDARVLVARADGAIPPSFELVQDLTLANVAVGGEYGASGTRGGLAAGDVDGDGLLDLVILTRPLGEDGAWPQLLVVPGSTGALDPDGVTLLQDVASWSAALGTLNTTFDVRAFALVDVDADAVVDGLAFADPEHVGFFTKDYREQSNVIGLTSSFDVPGATRLVAGHFDGDNLIDLAAATPRGVLLFRQDPSP